MTISLDTLYFLLYALSGLLLGSILLIAFFRIRFYYRKKRRLQLLALLLKSFEPHNVRSLRHIIQQAPGAAFDMLLELSQQCRFHQDHRSLLVTLIRETGIESRYQSRLTSGNIRKRIDAAIHLSALPCENTKWALIKALEREKVLRAKLYFCYGLASIKAQEAIPLMTSTLLGAPQWYRTRVNMMLSSFGRHFHDYASQLIHREEIEFQSLLVDFAAQYPSELLKNYLLSKTASPHKDIAYRATRTLGIFYCGELNKPEFICHADPILRNIAIQALDKIPTRQTIDNLLPVLSDDRSRDYAAVTISQITVKAPLQLHYILQLFQEQSSIHLQEGLAKVLSNRIEYLLMSVITGQSPQMRSVLEEIIKLGNTNGIIGFLNKNRTVEIENEILSILQPLMPVLSDPVRNEFCLYLKPQILEKMGYAPLQFPPAARKSGAEKDKVFLLSILLPVVFLTVPLIYCFRYWDYLPLWTLHTHLNQFVLDFNYYIAFYSLAVNSSYLLLLFFSLLAMMQQAKYWRMKKSAFLFYPRMLPSISIIAPAYQEESTVIESVNSLLNLHYPNYEVILVNDGSTDNTLNRLISHFGLERLSRVVPSRLQTRPIRGIYASPKIPKLLVVDKANGGKADALNVGINCSQKEFFCCIDADSLLEKDSLLKMAAMVIDAPSEPVAVGGNIFPVNGCTVSKGKLTQVNIPKNHLARFQTIEYLRSFMAGRLGWAYLRSLLIISGALGLFRKDRIIEVGGYLSSSERYKKDTVGEDMELVVRLSRHMQEKELPYSVLYAYNANCWTEVPESFGTLHRQRDRWQRGLIDILYFHRKMQLNPRYGRVGLLSMPYFFLFEMFGPFIEAQGYLAVVAAFFLGLLDVHLSLLLFISSILIGLLVSTFSLVIAEKENPHFPGPYMVTMLLYATLENFGVRQVMSFARVTGYINTLRQATGWNKLARKGFNVPKQTSDFPKINSST